jgi:hypothetical protein
MAESLLHIPLFVPKMTITKCHRLCGLPNRNLLSHCFVSLKSRLAPPEVMRETLFQAASLASCCQSFVVPWLIEAKP